MSVTLRQQGGNRSKTISLAESERISRERQRAYADVASRSIRDIAPLPVDRINWVRRLSTYRNLRLFCETYLGGIFYMEWSKDQLEAIDVIEKVFFYGSQYAYAMPRGGGKTALCRGAILWGTAHAHRKFPFLIGNKEDKAIQSLEALQRQWQMNPMLQQDFPEIGHSIACLEGQTKRAEGQIYNGLKTYVACHARSLRYPCIIMSEELGKQYLRPPRPDGKRGWVGMKKYGVSQPLVEKFDNGELRGYIARSAGIMLGVDGIRGGVRGEAATHPLLLTQPRPDVVILDDIQKDLGADSPTVCEKLIRTVDSAVKGLAGPGGKMAALMPCTIICKDDVSSHFLDQQQRPEWHGKRGKLVVSWPEGITDTTIGTDTTAGKKWNEYAKLWKKSYRLHQDSRLAREYYAKNRKVMDEDFLCSWQDNFNKPVDDNDPEYEISAQQHAMNLRLEIPAAFPYEYQNTPPDDQLPGGFVMLTPQQLAHKVIATPRLVVPLEAQYVTATIDIQMEVLVWQVMACDWKFSGAIIAEGTWPQFSTRIWRKSQTVGWSLMSRAFFQRYPDQRKHAVVGGQGKKPLAPLEAKIYFALGECCKLLKELPLVREGSGDPVPIGLIGLDSSWGLVSSVIKAFCRQGGFAGVVPMAGKYVSPAQRQLHEWNREKGKLFESQVHPSQKEDKWVYQPDQGGQYHYLFDTDLCKDFLHARLASPPGSPGSISLHNEEPEYWEQLSRQICASELPTLVESRGIQKNHWSIQEQQENEHLDCAAMNIVLQSRLGAALRVDGDPQQPMKTATRSLRELYDLKRRESA